MVTTGRIFRCTTITMFLVVVVAVAGCGWPQSRYGPELTGANPFERAIAAANVSQLQLRWTQNNPNRLSVVASPAIANGTLYLGTDKLYALDARTGSARWSSVGIGIGRAAPAVDGGRAYVTATEGGTTSVHSFDATNGELRWSRPIAFNGYRFAPTVAGGNVYVSSDRLSAFDAATGAVRWSADIGPDPGLGSPAVANGVAYVSADKLYAFDAATGTQRWTAEVGPVAAPAVANGVVYVSGGANLYALSATTGAQLWSTATGAGSAPAIANGVVYIGGTELRAFDAGTGSPRWSVGGCCGFGAPTVANGVVYGGSDGISGYDATTGKPLWSSTATGSSLVVADGVLYSGGERVSAYSIPSAGPQLSLASSFPEAFAFPDSTEATFALTNVGSTPTSRINASVVGPDAAAFRLSRDHCTGTTLVAGARCTFTTSFAPTRSGPHAARLTSTAAAGGTADAVLIGSAPRLALSRTTLFGPAFVGSTSTAVFTLTNLSGLPAGPVTSSVGAASSFTISADTCAGRTIPSASSCTIGVTFAPTWNSESSATLVATTPNDRAQASFSATGMSRLAVKSSSESFGVIPVGTTASMTFTVTNVSTTAAGPLSAGINSYGGMTWFRFGADTCTGRTLAPNASCTIVVVLAPTNAFPLFPLGYLGITAPLAGSSLFTLFGGAT